ncbi:hypothetical protein K7432_013604 [Basidiobolus ranarum]|uniref:Uncharacterized protein n=1 Tax=Basidiobolus ranarum TaxID=34480 RepID=A0ABR2WJ42_9FUNG
MATAVNTGISRKKTDHLTVLNWRQYLHSIFVSISTKTWYVINVLVVGLLSITVLPVFYVLKPVINALVDSFQKSSLYEPTTNFLTKNRGFFILCFALPLSFFFDGYFRLRNWYVRKFLSTPYLHDQRVRGVQAQVKKWNQSGRKGLMCTARPTWMTMSTRIATFKEDCSRISINLHDILELI